MKKILVIIGSWPSKTHPYLVWLFFQLKQVFPEMIIFHFNRPELEYGYSIIGKQAVEQVMKGSLYRKPFSRNPVSHLKVGIKVISHFKQCKKIYFDCIRQGMSLSQAYGQLYYYQDLIGRNFDLVHINALQTARHFPSKHIFGKAIVIASSRGQDFDFFPNHYDTVLTKINHLHVLGMYLENKARERGYEGPITIIPPAFPPLDDGTNKRQINQKIIIATAARLSWVKGLEYCLYAIHKLVAMGYDISYNIYGDGEEKEKLTYLTNCLGLSDRVHFYGWINEKHLRKELLKIDIYLLLAITEAFNNSVLLAQALGVPCIVSDAGGLPENVADGISGRIVPRYDATAAAAAIAQLIDDPTYLQKLSAGARARVWDNFSLDRQVTNYVEMYETALTAN